MKLAALQKYFCPMSYKVYWFLFFGSSGTGNYSSISKLLGETHMHLILQLIVHVMDCQKLSSDLLIVLQMLDRCQVPVSIFLTLLTGTVRLLSYSSFFRRALHILIWQNHFESRGNVLKDQVMLIILLIRLLFNGCLCFLAPGPLLGPRPRPRPPICIYRPWSPICIYRSWHQICIYWPWPPPCVYLKFVFTGSVKKVNGTYREN